MLNPLNHCTQPAAQRLVDKGIVLETEAVWASNGLDCCLIEKDRVMSCFPTIPAPSMAEVLRELPDEYVYHDEGKDIYDHSRPILKKCKDYYVAGYPSEHYGFKMFDNVNPTDALIDLLIFTKGLETEHADAQRRADFGPNGDATTPGFFIKTKTEA